MLLNIILASSGVIGWGGFEEEDEAVEVVDPFDMDGVDVPVDAGSGISVG